MSSKTPKTPPAPSSAPAVMRQAKPVPPQAAAQTPNPVPAGGETAAASLQPQELLNMQSSLGNAYVQRLMQPGHNANPGASLLTPQVQLAPAEAAAEPSSSLLSGQTELTQVFKGEKAFRHGDTGEGVKKLQEALLAAGYSLGKYGADGSFGDATKKAVEAFQTAQGLNPDGIVGKNTIKALDKLQAPAGGGNTGGQPAGDKEEEESGGGDVTVTKDKKGRITVTVNGEPHVFKPAKYKEDSGHVYHGKERPDTADLEQKLQDLGLPSDDARILALVSAHEGGFDTIQTYDSALFTWGFIQFAGTGGLQAVMKTIKAVAPADFEEYFHSNGLDVTDKGQITIQKGDELLTGQAALQELHDNPETWGWFLQASQDSDIKLAQVKTAYDSYYIPSGNISVKLGKDKTTLGSLFAGNDFARAMLFDRSVQRGLGGARWLFQKAITNSKATSAEDVQKILDAAKEIDTAGGYGKRWTDIETSF